MPEIIERLIYCSTATVPTESLLVIADILATSDRNNRRDRLTGALAISNGWFLQVIEGTPDNLDLLLRRLRADSRHKDLEILQRRVVAARLFSSWTMASARVTPALAPALVRLIDDCRVAPDAALAGLLEIVAGEAVAGQTMVAATH